MRRSAIHAKNFFSHACKKTSTSDNIYKIYISIHMNGTHKVRVKYTQCEWNIHSLEHTQATTTSKQHNGDDDTFQSFTQHDHAPEPFRSGQNSQLYLISVLHSTWDWNIRRIAIISGPRPRSTAQKLQLNAVGDVARRREHHQQYKRMLAFVWAPNCCNDR